MSFEDSRNDRSSGRPRSYRDRDDSDEPQRSRGRGGYGRGNDRDSEGGRDSGRSFGRGRDSGRSFGGRSSGRSFGNDRDNRRLEMHNVICSSCGEECQVPFKPTSNKPVFCSDCFADEDKNDRKSSPAGNNSNSDLKIIKEKLNKIMKALKIE